MISCGVQVLDATWAVSEGPDGMEAGLKRICEEADQAIQDGYSYLIMSDRATGLLAHISCTLAYFCAAAAAAAAVAAAAAAAAAVAAAAAAVE